MRDKLIVGMNEKEDMCMIREIMKDPMFLQAKSVDATSADKEVIQDLLDTIMAHKDHCVGMAANMIGVHKNIIIFWDDIMKDYQIMLNPSIMKTSGQKYEVEEGCLSLSGERKTVRYSKIKVRYFDCDMKVKIKSYDGFTAQIIQHEIDHCKGILI